MFLPPPGNGLPMPSPFLLIRCLLAFDSISEVLFISMYFVCDDNKCVCGIQYMNNAKIEARSKAPPANVSIKPRSPFAGFPLITASSAVLSIPGSRTNVPIRNTANNNSVFKIRDLSSSMLNIFLIVVINFFIGLKGFQRFRQLSRLLLLLLPRMRELLLRFLQ